MIHISNKPEWTEMQDQAINHRGKGIIVSAAAGSGKTAVLIERVIRLLSDRNDPVPADTLLAVTFTNAAAAQLREKLTSALAEKLQALSEDNSPEAKKDLKWLEEQQSRLQMAKIQTINAFCLELVKNNAHALGLQSGIRILEENDITIIEGEMFNEAINYFYRNHPKDIELLSSKMCRNKSDIVTAVKAVYDYTRSIPFSDKFMKKSLAKLRDKGEIDKYCRNIMTSMAALCDEVIRQIGRAQGICRGLAIQDGIDDILADDILNITALKNELEAFNWDKAYSLLNSYKFATNKKKMNKDVISKYEDSYPLQLNADQAARELIADIRSDIKDKLVNNKLKNAMQCPMKDIVKDSQTSAKLARIVCRIAEYAEKLITEEKLSRNGCDFADVELMTVQLLATIDGDSIKRTDLCEEIVRSKEYRVILIDEFQDTNDLQELIFKCLSDTDDLAVLGKNVFVVGDIKQAIYGFRGSNPKLFSNARANAELEKYKSVLEKIDLAENFRSRRGIIDFANFLFSHLMSKEVGGVDYDTDSERLNFAAKYDDVNYPAEFIICDDKKGDDPYLAVASKIKSMLESGEQVFDLESKSYRNCRPSDFCILSRTNAHNYKFSQAFEQYGLKMSCREIDGYLKSREISLMISLLKVLDNPFDNLAMLSVLLSPILSFTDDEVASLRIAFREEKLPNKLYLMLTEANREPDPEEEQDTADDNSGKASSKKKKEPKLPVDLPDDLKGKCADAVDRIRKMRYYASCLPIEQLIRKLYDETEFYVLTAAFAGGELAQANLRLLLEFATDYDTNCGGGLTGFLRYLDNVTAYKKDFKQAATVTDETGAVNVMTMHKSKGLQFPFVFLFDLKRQFQFDSSDLIVINENGIGIKITDDKLLIRYPTCAHASIAIDQRAAVISEELRLLYVAVTRTKERLFIPVTKPSGNSLSSIIGLLSGVHHSLAITPDIAASASSMLEWVLAACAFHAGGQQLLHELGIDIPGTLPISSDKNIITFSPAAVVSPAHESDDIADDESSFDIDDKLTQSISEVLLQSSIQTDESLAKRSVSDIVHHSAEQLWEFPRIPALSKTNKKFSAAQRGTLTHRFLELCDFDGAKANAKAELKRLVSLGRFSEHEAGGVYIDAIENFFSGELAERMMASKNILREKEFMVKLSDLNLPSKKQFDGLAGSDGMLQGIADCLFEENGGYILVDYKTDKVSDLQELVKRYDSQLELYKAALSLVLDKEITDCIIYSLYLNGDISINT